jgi:hypothetical protein
MHRIRPRRDVEHTRHDPVLSNRRARCWRLELGVCFVSDHIEGLPDDLARILRDQSVIIPQHAAVFEAVAKWSNAPSNTPSAGPVAGQVWEDRGTKATVEKVMPDGGAIVIVGGLRHPVHASYFTRARLLPDEGDTQ